MPDIRLALHAAAIRALAQDPMTQPLMERAGDAVADTAARLAPKRTGAGAGSIQAEVERDATGWHAKVSWDRDHFYMHFHELGTSRHSPRPFLRPALDATI